MLVADPLVLKALQPRAFVCGKSMYNLFLVIPAQTSPTTPPSRSKGLRGKNLVILCCLTPIHPPQKTYDFDSHPLPIDIPHVSPSRAFAEVNSCGIGRDLQMMKHRIH